MNPLSRLLEGGIPDAYLPDLIILCALGALLALYLALRSTFTVRIEQGGLAEVLQVMLRNPDNIPSGRTFVPRLRMRRAGLHPRRSVAGWWCLQLLLPLVLGTLAYRWSGSLALGG